MAEAKAWVIIPKSVNKGTECVLEMQPLVLCKNCKYLKTVNFRELNCNKLFCNQLLDYVPSPDWFCADGEEISDVQKSD